MTDLTFASFFSGIGGADQGLTNAGFQHVFGMDSNLKVIKARKKLYGETIQHKKFLNLSPKEVPDVDLHWYSPPCQNASQANPNRGDLSADEWLSRGIPKRLPRWIVIENVIGYAPVMTTIRDKLTRLGYECDRQLYESCYYGGHQTRKRLILRAWRNPADRPEEVFATRGKPKSWGKVLMERGVMDSLTRLPLLDDEELGTYLLSPDKRPVPPNEPSPTVTGGWLRSRPKLHINGKRYQGGVALGAALQGLKYPVGGWPQNQILSNMVGDAVPEPLAYAIACSFLGKDWRIRENSVNGILIPH